MIAGANMLNGWQVAAAVSMWGALALVGAVVARDVSAGFIVRFNHGVRALHCMALSAFD